jgi:hypothetical protein
VIVDDAQFQHVGRVAARAVGEKAVEESLDLYSL